MTNYKKTKSADSILIQPSELYNEYENCSKKQLKRFSFNSIFKNNPKLIYNRLKLYDNIPTKPFEINNNFDALPPIYCKTINN